MKRIMVLCCSLLFFLFIFSSKAFLSWRNTKEKIRYGWEQEQKNIMDKMTRDFHGNSPVLINPILPDGTRIHEAVLPHGQGQRCFRPLMVGGPRAVTEDKKRKDE